MIDSKNLTQPVKTENVISVNYFLPLIVWFKILICYNNFSVHLLAFGFIISFASFFFFSISGRCESIDYSTVRSNNAK